MRNQRKGIDTVLQAEGPRFEPVCSHKERLPIGSLSSFMQYTVYIIYSSTADRFYVGFTGDEIEERLRKHNSNHKGFTGKFNDWQVVYTEIFTTKQEAMVREKEMKAWKSRSKIQTLINS